MSEGAEDSGEKTEEPSERQRQKSRQKGQVPRSRDMMAALHSLILFAFLGLSELLIKVVTKIYSDYDELLISGASDPLRMIEQLRANFASFPSLIIPMALIVVASCVLGAVVSGPLIFSTEIMGFKIQRINPFEGIKKVLSIRGGVEVVKALIKSLLLGMALYMLLNVYFDSVMSLQTYTLFGAAQQGMHILLSTGICFSLVMLVIAVPDVMWQKYRAQKDLMLTRQQARESHKNEEGSPESRQRLRKVQRQQASVERKKMLDSVPDADLVITNPEHFAVALQYSPEKHTAPVVIAKGVDFLAELITQKAHHAKKPILIQPMLTRAIYYHTEVGQDVSTDLYNAVAKVMVYLYQLDQYQRDKSTRRPKPPIITVPDKYDYLRATI